MTFPENTALRSAVIHVTTHGVCYLIAFLKKKHIGCHVAKGKKRNVKLINSMCHGSRDRYAACLYTLGK